MSIYTNAVERTISLDIPVVPQGDSIEVTVYDNGVLVHTPNTVTFEDGVLSFTLPFTLTQSDKELEIKWVFTYVEDGQTYEYDNTSSMHVVTPILPMKEIRRILGPDFSAEEAADVERSVRYVIQAHTGQFFGKYIGKKFISGGGEPYLRMPMRLMELKTVNGNTYWNDSLALRGSGFYLQSLSFGVPPLKADYDGWHESPWGYSNRAPIVAPYSKNVFKFVEHAQYEINGVWGWRDVPGAVQEAARLLINDYACADSAYRDRFLTSMTAADWRIQFHEGAFSNTGNVRANQLLAEYVLRRGWVVI